MKLPGNMQAMMKQAQVMQEKLQQEIEGTADGAPKNVVQLRSMK